MRISLRTQIFLWYAVIATFLIVGIVFAAQQVIEHRLEASIDRGLEERTDLLAAAITGNPKLSVEAYDDLIEWLTEQELSNIPAVLRVSDPKGNVLASFGDVPDAMIPRMNQQLLAEDSKREHAEDGWYQTISIRGHPALRIYTVPVKDSSNEVTIVLLQTADSLGQIAAAREELWLYSLGVGIGGSIFALLAGYFLLRRGFRPLDRILHRVEGIETTTLTDRIPEERRPPELQGLANRLNEMLSRLDTAFRERETFVASVSHDLRTPLTILQGQLEIMLMHGSLDEATKISLNRMKREVRRLSRMTNNLLLTAQLETTQEYCHMDIDLKELLEEVGVEARVLADGISIAVSTPHALVVPGDYDLIKQMLLNVIDNAVRFSTDGGVVEIELNQKNGYAMIRVSDHGQGMSAEIMAHVGQPFYKSEHNRKGSRRAGTGLGLYIVRQIIDLHKGKMDIRSSEGIGTTVTLYLPANSGQ